MIMLDLVGICRRFGLCLIHHQNGEILMQGLCLFDWGRRIDCSLFPDDMEFMGDCRTSGFCCIEMQENKRWEFQVDTYGLCVIVHMMLHSTYMTVEKKTASDGSSVYLPKFPFKRYWNVNLWEKIVRDLQGKFPFILYDSSSKVAFIVVDADGSIPFYWGTDSEGHLVVSEDVEIVKKDCGKSFAPFPKGCFYTSSGGLRSFEHPRNEVKPVPRVDNSGEVCGANFKVDSDAKRKQTGMPRVGSEANWSSEY